MAVCVEVALEPLQDIEGVPVARARGELGRMVALHGERIESVSISDACGRLKLVDPDGELARVARSTGVELGAPAKD